MQKKQKHSKHTKLLMRKSALVRDNSNRIKSLPRGNKHWNFKEKPSILALHKRIHRKFGSAKNYKCELCPNNGMDWALIAKNYSDNRSDYKPLCRKCHVNMDKPWDKVDRSKIKIIRDIKGRFTNVISAK